MRSSIMIQSLDMIKKSRRQPVDGVVQRQKRARVGDFNNTQPISQPAEVKATREINKSTDVDEQVAENVTDAFSMDLDNVDENIDDVAQPSGGRRSRRSKRRLKRQQKKSERSTLNNRLRKAALVFGALVLFVGGFVAFKSWAALNRIIVDRDGGGSPLLTGAELNGEGDGRINIMLLGVGGEGHDGGNLADTIIVASIDPVHNEVALLSVPRDMYVDVPGYWSMRVNAAHATGIDQGHPEGGPGLMKETLEATLDIPIHYYALVDFTGFMQAVNTVGGVDLYVEDAVYDTHFASGGYILDVPEGWQYFDGERALFYSRSRYTSPRGDFDRNDRQRQILIALKEKVLSIGTFADPLKITSLADTAGDHVKTNLQLGEITRLYDIASEIPGENIASYGLSTAADNYLGGANIGGASVLTPNTGDYSEIQRFVRELFVDGFIRSEAAEVEMYDGSGLGLLLEKQDELSSYGYNLGHLAEYPQLQPNTVIYDLSGGEAPKTKNYLEQRFGITMTSGDQLPSTITTEAAFVIILGADGEEG